MYPVAPGYKKADLLEESGRGSGASALWFVQLCFPELRASPVKKATLLTAEVLSSGASQGAHGLDCIEKGKKPSATPDPSNGKMQRHHKLSRFLWMTLSWPRDGEEHPVLNVCFCLTLGLFRRCCKGESVSNELPVPSRRHESALHQHSKWRQGSLRSDRLLQEQGLLNTLPTRCFGGGPAA